MPQIVVPMTTPAPPQREATATRVTVRADTLQAFAEGVIHNALVTHGGVLAKQAVIWPAAWEPIDRRSPRWEERTHWIRFKAGPWTEWVGFSVGYQAAHNRPAGSGYGRDGQPAQLRASLWTDERAFELDKGGMVDLVRTDVGRGAGRRWRQEFLDWPMFNTMPPMYADPRPADTVPRAMRVPSLYRGQTLDLKLETWDVRILTVAVWQTFHGGVVNV